MDCDTFTLIRKGLFSIARGISSHTFSSLRQTGNRPSWRVAPRETSAKGFGADGSGGAGRAAAMVPGATPEAASAAAAAACGGVPGAVAGGAPEAAGACSAAA